MIKTILILLSLAITAQCADIVLGNASDITWVQGEGANKIAVFGSAWSPLSLSPVLWYKGNDNAIDSSGNGFTGTWSGTPTYTNGVNGRGFCFNGASAITKSFESGLANTNMTICFWANSSGGAGTLRVAMSTRQVSPNKGYYVGISSGNAWLMSFAISDASFQTAGSSAVEYSTFKHYAVRYTGTAMELYVNGVLSLPVNTSAYLTATTSALMVGALVDGGPRLFFLGCMDDVMVFNKTLTTNEIAQIYNYRE